MTIKLHVWLNMDHLCIKCEKTFEILRSEITFVMDLYIMTLEGNGRNSKIAYRCEANTYFQQYKNSLLEDK